MANTGKLQRKVVKTVNGLYEKLHMFRVAVEYEGNYNGQESDIGKIKKALEYAECVMREMNTLNKEAYDIEYAKGFDYEGDEEEGG